MVRLLVIAAFLLSAPTAAHTRLDSIGSEVLQAVARDLCDRDVALLGEADHGDGRTIAFKVALVQRLVNDCGYDAVFFEASHYDFLELARRARLGETVSPDMLASAIGGHWRYDTELQPLIHFLFERAQAGRLALGGLDDQLGSAGAFYSNDGMPEALAAYLPDARRAECRALLTRRIHGASGIRADPERGRSLLCLTEIGRSVERGRDPITREAHLAMLAGIDRAIDRDRFFTENGMDVPGYVRARDRAMYIAFRRLAGRLTRRSRIIVWAANSHVAKDATMTRDYAGSRNFGAFIREAYGVRAFALGFSALSGTHYWTRQEPSRAFQAAAPGSLEARAMAGGRADAAYLAPARLAALGAVPGSLFMHQPLTTRWSDVMDAVIVFDVERAPRRID